MISMRSKYALKALSALARATGKEAFLIAELAQESSARGSVGLALDAPLIAYRAFKSTIVDLLLVG